jgi:hypothetical protein
MSNKPIVGAVIPDNIPEHMRALESFGVWAQMQRPSGEWHKPPFRAADFDPQNPIQFADMTNPTHWVALESAQAALDRGLGLEGINFNIARTNVACVDFDNCLDERGQPLPWVVNFLERAVAAGLFLERSPRMRGVHAWGLATGGKVHRKFAGVGGPDTAVEIFRTTNKVITVTGMAFGAVNGFGNADAFVDYLTAYLDAQKSANEKASPGDDLDSEDLDEETFDPDFAETPRQGETPDYDAILREGVAAAPRGGKKTRSEWFSACVWHLAAHGFDAEEQVAIFEQFPNGVAERYIAEGRLDKQVAECFGAWQKTRAKEQRQRAKPQPGPVASPDDELVVVRASAIDPGDPEWLWPNRFALGEVGLLAGMPDRGKGLITLDTIARVTTGAHWPCDADHKAGECCDLCRNERGPQSVIMLSAEDALNHTVIPRLIAAGTDRDRVHIIEGIKTKTGQRLFSLLEDPDRLEALIEQLGDVGLLSIDPINAYLGVAKMDSHRDSDTRGVVAPINAHARRRRICIVGIKQFKKNERASNAIVRVSESIAWGAAPRSVYAVFKDPESGERTLCKVKNNIVPDNLGGTMAYEIREKQIGVNTRTNRPSRHPYVHWLGASKLTIEEALANENGQKDKVDKTDAARAFIRDFLKDGSRYSDDLLDAGVKAGFALATLRLARRSIPIVMDKDKGIGGRWKWTLAEDRDTAHEEPGVTC